MQRIRTAQALQNHRLNEAGSWNRTTSSAVRSEHPGDGANRIHDGFARIEVEPAKPLLRGEDPIFAMGSCFAREIERHLARRGAAVISLDDTVDRPEFRGHEERLLTGFFNRFNPRAMLQEFQWCFDELPGWRDDSLLVKSRSGVVDLNYWRLPDLDTAPAATAARRRIARGLVRQAVRAKVVILTLGLVEAWLHKPSGFYLNGISAPLAARTPNDYELHLLDYQDTLDCLEGVLDLLRRRSEVPAVRIVITVSPVPMQSTFTDQDVVVANMTSKAVLRAAATEFASRHANVDYFPSYEFVVYSAPELAWRPDRIHVENKMVAHIVDRFEQAYYQPGALWPAVDLSRSPRWATPEAIRLRA